MNGTRTEDQTYSGTDFTKEPLRPGQYDHCPMLERASTPVRSHSWRPRHHMLQCEEK